MRTARFFFIRFISLFKNDRNGNTHRIADGIHRLYYLGFHAVLHLQINENNEQNYWGRCANHRTTIFRNIFQYPQILRDSGLHPGYFWLVNIIVALNKWKNSKKYVFSNLRKLSFQFLYRTKFSIEATNIVDEDFDTVKNYSFLDRSHWELYFRNSRCTAGASCTHKWGTNKIGVREITLIGVTKIEVLCNSTDFGTFANFRCR